ncbi:MAG: TRAP transporter large permease subunit, partial [Thermodesulfobacteriota bacterium]
IEIGALTPPVGFNCYIIKGVAPEVPLETIFRGTGTFVLLELVSLGLLVAFPEIALWLPRMAF